MPEKRKCPDENAVLIEIRDSILDNLDIAILVSDMATNEILYANAKQQQMYGEEPLVGRICWEVLKNEDRRCRDCPIPHLLKNPGDTYQREICREDGCFLSHDRIIPWSGGKLAHLRYLIEVEK